MCGAYPVLGVTPGSDPKKEMSVAFPPGAAWDCRAPNRHLLELPMDNLEFRISMEQRIEIIMIRMLEEEERRT